MTLAPVPTAAPDAIAPVAALKSGVTCNEEGHRCPKDHHVCVVRDFGRCFSEDDIRREMPKAAGLPPVSTDPCGKLGVCPAERPYCIWDSVSGCIALETATTMMRNDGMPAEKDVGVYGICTNPKDCLAGETCCRAFLGPGAAMCAKSCDLVNTQIQCTKDADCAPLRASCPDKACRDRVHCAATSPGFLKVCTDQADP